MKPCGHTPNANGPGSLGHRRRTPPRRSQRQAAAQAEIGASRTRRSVSPTPAPSGPVMCLAVKPVGKPDAGNRLVRFEERAAPSSSAKKPFLPRMAFWEGHGRRRATPAPDGLVRQLQTRESRPEGGLAIVANQLKVGAEPQKLSRWTPAGVSTASAIGGRLGLPAENVTERSAAPKPWAAIGSLYAGSATAMQYPSGKSHGARFAACF
jgi:hypothetical protein